MLQFGCGRQQKRHAVSPPPAGMRRRMERNRQKLVGRDKGSLTEQKTKATVTTMIQIRRVHNTNRTTQRAAAPDRHCALPSCERVPVTPLPPTGTPHDGTWYGIPCSVWPGGVSVPSSWWKLTLSWQNPEQGSQVWPPSAARAPAEPCCSSPATGPVPSAEHRGWEQLPCNVGVWEVACTAGSGERCPECLTASALARPSLHIFCFSASLHYCCCYFVLVHRLSWGWSFCCSHTLIFWVLSWSCVHANKCPSFPQDCRDLVNTVCRAEEWPDYYSDAIIKTLGYPLEGSFEGLSSPQECKPTS